MKLKKFRTPLLLIALLLVTGTFLTGMSPRLHYVYVSNGFNFPITVYTRQISSSGETITYGPSSSYILPENTGQVAFCQFPVQL